MLVFACLKLSPFVGHREDIRVCGVIGYTCVQTTTLKGLLLDSNHVSKLTDCRSSFKSNAIARNQLGWDEALSRGVFHQRLQPVKQLRRKMTGV